MSVILYEHINFRGRHKHIINRSERNLHKDGWGDRVSSIQVIGGAWDFYQHTNFGGRRVRLGPGNYSWVRNVGISNDSISSVRKVTPLPRMVPTSGCIVYEHAEFRGRHKHLIGRDESNLHADGWGDKISSIIVISGRWAFYQHTNYRGRVTILEPGMYNIISESGIANDSISSIRRFNPRVTVPSMKTREMIIYQDIDYGGDHKHLINRGDKSLHADGWGDKLSSLQVISGDKWTLHQHTNYGGNKVKIGPGNHRWIVDTGMGNDRVSSVRANIIPVYFTTIQGASPTINGDLSNANSCFNQYDIEIFEIGRATQNAPSLLDLDQPTCFMNQTPSDEEDQLFDIDRAQNPDTIVAYYLRSTSRGLAGCAAFPSDRPGVVMTDFASPWTFGHEIGHVLGLPHVTSSSNLMSTPTASITSNPPILSNSQQNTIKSSNFLV